MARYARGEHSSLPVIRESNAEDALPRAPLRATFSSENRDHQSLSANGCRGDLRASVSRPGSLHGGSGTPAPLTTFLATRFPSAAFSPVQNRAGDEAECTCRRNALFAVWENLAGVAHSAAPPARVHRPGVVAQLHRMQPLPAGAEFHSIAGVHDDPSRRRTVEPRYVRIAGERRSSLFRRARAVRVPHQRERELEL